jgi:hypothetical protein
MGTAYSKKSVARNFMISTVPIVNILQDVTFVFFVQKRRHLLYELTSDSGNYSGGSKIGIKRGSGERTRLRGGSDSMLEIGKRYIPVRNLGE